MFNLKHAISIYLRNRNLESSLYFFALFDLNKSINYKSFKMAFVIDSNDPGGGGMFSKPGRFTNEKYIVFHKKDEILSNQRKFLKVTSVLNLNFVLNFYFSLLQRILIKIKSIMMTMPLQNKFQPLKFPPDLSFHLWQ